MSCGRLEGSAAMFACSGPELAASAADARTLARATDDSNRCGDGYAGDNALEVAVCGEVRSFPCRVPDCSGITRRNPPSLGVRDPLADGFGGVPNRVIKGLTGAGLGMRGEASEVLP